MRIGSISKVFCGNTLASLLADHQIALTDRLQDRLGPGFAVPAKDGKAIRIVDLATHASGLPREAATEMGPPENPFATNTPPRQRSPASRATRCSSLLAPACATPTTVSTCSRPRWPTRQASPTPSSFRSAS